MARYLCVLPCLTPPSAFLSVKIPLGGGGDMTASAGLTFSADCNGCRATSDLLVKVEPMLGALGPFLDTLGCIAAAIKMLKEVPPALATLDATLLIDLATELVGKCKNLLGLSTFPGTIVCDFLSMTNDILRLLRAALLCFLGLLQHGLSLNLNAILLLGDIDPQVRRNGECLATRVQRNVTTVNTRASVLSDLIVALQAVFDLLSIANLSFDDIKNGAGAFAAFLSSQVPDTPELVQEYLAEAVEQIAKFDKTIADTLAVTEVPEGLCP